MSAGIQIIARHFDNPDRALDFVVSALDSYWAEYYGLDFDTENTECHTIQVTATYPFGCFTRAITFGEVSHAQSDQLIFGGKQ